MTMFNLLCRVTMSAVLLVIVSACGSDGIEVTAEFSNTQDIDEGVAVYFDDEPIGRVVDTATNGNGMVVTIAFDQPAAERVSRSSAVVVNRLKQGAPLEIYNSSETEPEGVQDGQSIKGLDSMFQLGAWMVGDAIQLGSNSLTSYVSAFQEYLQSDNFAQGKENVQEQVSTAASQAQQAIDEMSAEIASAMQELSVTEEQAAAAIEQLGDELAPVVEEIANSGSLLMQQLQEFTESLENIDETEQQAGQTFLESLTVLLERLNQTIEEGSESVERDLTETQ